MNYFYKEQGNLSLADLICGCFVAAIPPVNLIIIGVFLYGLCSKIVLIK
jgi:hypothetical protein